MSDFNKNKLPDNCRLPDGIKAKLAGTVTITLPVGDARVHATMIRFFAQTFKPDSPPRFELGKLADLLENTSENMEF